LENLKTKKIIPIILCGGSGTRLWPKSREVMPKQFLTLLGEDSLLQATAQRALNVLDCRPEDVVTVTISDMKSQTHKQLNDIDPALTNHILTEPVARNTAAAVAYATHYVWETFGEDAYALILLADHYIGNEMALKHAITDAYDIAKDDYIVTFGITPTHPETGFGYIKKSAEFNGSLVRHVDQFVEKPALDVAKEYLASGDYLWSSGMHLFKVKKVIKGFHMYAKETIRLVEASMQDGHSKRIPSEALYSQIYKQPFETAVLEKLQRVAVVQCDMEWSDVGTFNSLWDIREKDVHGNVTDGNVACYKTQDCFVQSEGRLVACVGVKDLVVMETPDAILIADKHRSDDLKVMVKSLQETQPTSVSQQYKHSYTWGSTKVLSKEYDCITSEVVVKPGANRCLHMNNTGQKLCTVISGRALVKIGDETHLLTPQKSLTIEEKIPHLIMNAGNQDLYMIEVQYGVKDGVSNIQRIDSDTRLFA
jgi:mannose-1-phosphate guanylyltransferase